MEFVTALFYHITMDNAIVMWRCTFQMSPIVVSEVTANIDSESAKGTCT